MSEEYKKPLVDSDLWTEEERMKSYKIRCVNSIIDEGIKNIPEKDGEIHIPLTDQYFDFFQEYRKEILKSFRDTFISTNLFRFSAIDFSSESQELVIKLKSNQ